MNFAKEVEHPWIDKDFSTICNSLEDIQSSFLVFLEKGYKTLAVKSPFGASGEIF